MPPSGQGNLRQPQEEHLEILGDLITIQMFVLPNISGFPHLNMIIYVCFIGPIIRAEVGQVLLITFMNKASHSYSIQAHGVRTSSKPEAVMPGRGSWNIHHLPPHLTCKIYTKTPSGIHKAVFWALPDFCYIYPLNTWHIMFLLWM